MEAPATSGDGRRWPWLLGAAAIAAAIVAIAAVRLTAIPATAVAPPAEVSPSASAIPLLPIGTSSAQAEPAVAASVSGKARAGGRAPRPKSSRPAILDSPY
jgi:hypothetical protein